MKVLLFTHSQDIDGMGCALLAKAAFGDYDLVPTKTFEITSNVQKYIESKMIYTYDKIFVTDLCIKEPVLETIDKDEYLKKHLIVLDHHKSEIEEGNNKYDFVNVIVEQNGLRVSGTYLFYQYLVENGLLERKSILDEIVEWTRQYDVWDHEKMNNPGARYLHILFEVLGYKNYLNLMQNKINNLDHIKFTKYERDVIADFEVAKSQYISKAISQMKVVDLNINGEVFKVGYVYSKYRFRNDFNSVLKSNNLHNLDCIGMIMTDMDSVSYRQVKDIDVSKISTYYGGKGHRVAGAHPKDNLKFMEDMASVLI